jgi:two-component sensor histidine kinase
VPKQITPVQLEALGDSLIEAGDSIYAVKSSVESFKASMKCYDSAYTLAVLYKDTVLLAETCLAKGRVYDGWGKDPKATYYYYNLASQYFILLNELSATGYCRSLAAHALASSNDSSKAAVYMYATHQLLISDTSELQQGCYALLAYECSQIKNYTLLDTMVQQIKNIKDIENNGIDFKNKLIIALARRDVYKGAVKSEWILALTQLLKSVNNVSDSLTYANILYQFYKKTGNTKQVLIYDEIEERLRTQMFSDKQNADFNHELFLSKSREQELQESLKLKDNKILWLTGVLISCLVIGLIATIAILVRSRRRLQNYNTKLSSLNGSLEQQVQQVEILNKEMHHRVKNNMTLLYSIIQLQLGRSSNSDTIDTLQSVANRIESMSIMHQNILAKEAEVQLKEYINKMINSVINTFGIQKNIVTQLNLEPVTLSNKEAVSLGLIINEWIVNSLKYASLNNNVLSIQLSLSKTNNEVIVKYNDNGTIMPNKQSTPGLGTNIIELLAKQMNAQLKSEQFNYTLIIPNAATI